MSAAPTSGARMSSLQRHEGLICLALAGFAFEPEPDYGASPHVPSRSDRMYAARRATINRRLRLLALRTVLPRRTEIGAYIAGVVDNWDTATLVNRLELQVGKDLQYIRINGTLVGGLVGLVIFSLSRAFGG